jgi:hypothetical protein
MMRTPLSSSLKLYLNGRALSLTTNSVNNDGDKENGAVNGCVNEEVLLDGDLSMTSAPTIGYHLDREALDVLKVTPSKISLDVV